MIINFIDSEFDIKEIDKEINEDDIRDSINILDDEIVYAFDKIDDFIIVVIYSTTKDDYIKIIIIDFNIDYVLDEIIMENAFHSGMFYFYNDKIKLHLIIAHDDKESGTTKHVKIISVAKDGKIQKYNIKNTDVHELLDTAIAIPHKNYILYAENSLNVICLYDYIKKEVICINKLGGSGISCIHGFVKLNNIEKNSSILEKIYNDNNKDIKLNH